MRRIPNVMAWRLGATCVVALPDPARSRYTLGPGLLVVNDGVRWTARRTEHLTMEIAKLFHLPPTQWPPYTAWPGVPKMEPEFRLPVEWARRALKSAADDGRTEVTTAAQLDAPELMPRVRGPGDVSYLGFGKFAKRSAHSLADVHRVVDEAVALCAAAWGWECAGLVVKFHDDGRAFGLAYSIGEGATTGVRRISLNAKLLEAYDAESVSRVVLHELCHHYREERWPRQQSGPFYDAHDVVFCRELRLVDPAVKSAAKLDCAKFTDAMDPNLAVKLAMKQIAAEGPAPTWSPVAGEMTLVRLKSGHWRVTWEARKSAGFKWRKVTMRVTDPEMVELAKRFAPSEWENVPMEVENWPWSDTGTYDQRHPRPRNLGQMLRYFAKNYPRQLVKLNELLKEVTEAP